MFLQLNKPHSCGGSRSRIRESRWGTPACYNAILDLVPYCTISIDSAWGVTCDQMDEIPTTSNVGVTWDTV